ncbi:MAG: baseplate J/gp47 family protein [Oscillospiraceae bacterium]|jgi:uncharacterized phage protein gp47/JayE|nr:baseplate J/gp47 family protein [Oscillospiraceae bacterium]
MAFEAQTYGAIMDRILKRVPPDIDTREGSIIWDATAPAAVELAILYTALDFILGATFADTAPRPYLILRAAERGLTPKAATGAVLRAEFNREVPIGSRFSLENLNYVITERLPEDDTDDTRAYRVQCETPGAAGNELFGSLIPIEYISGLTSAVLVELLIPGADEEGTEVFRQRYIDSLTSQAFGGNRQDYKDKVLALPGVGAVKVFPAWNADIDPQSFVPDGEVAAWVASALPTLPVAARAWLTAVYTAAADLLLTVGGAVKLVLLDSAYGVPTDDLISDVQDAVDPPDGHGEGLGLAPIGHVVKAEGAQSQTIDVALTLQYQSGWDWAAVESYALEAIDAYFAELARGWQGSDALTVRVSQIETRLLDCPGVVDAQNTLLNGEAGNIALDAVHIPVRGVVSG